MLALFALPHSSGAHSGSVALAVPVEGITIDGDLSDWPDGMTRYPIQHREAGDPLNGAADFQGSFRVGYEAQEKALYFAVEIEDDSVLRQFTGDEGAQEGCEIYVEVSHQEGSSRPVQYWLRGEQSGMEGPGSMEDAEAEVRWEEGAYRYEWRVRLKADGVEPGRVLGMDMTLWDVDEDGTSSHMAWGKGNAQPLYSDQLGDLLLVGAEARSGSIRGQLSWADDERPVEHAAVRLLPHDSGDDWLQAKTDRRGAFRLELAEGSYRVVPGVGRHEGGDRTLDVQAGQEVSVVLTVPRSAGGQVAEGAWHSHLGRLGQLEGAVAPAGDRGRVAPGRSLPGYAAGPDRTPLVRHPCRRGASLRRHGVPPFH